MHPQCFTEMTERPQPDPYHARTGHTLANENSKVLKQIQAVDDYAQSNEMKLNLKKTKFMLFNACTSIDFLPTFNLGGVEIELVEEMKLLGLIITSDLKFEKNTEYIVKKAYKRVWMLKRLKNLGASTEQLLDVYQKQIRSVLELAVSVWHSSLVQADRLSIERVQKAALQVVLIPDCSSYGAACLKANLLTLEKTKKKLFYPESYFFV